MFGECIAVFLLMIQTNTFKISNYLELGPGNGLLLKDLVRTVYQIKKERLNYYFWEKSFFLKESFFEELKNKANIIKLKKICFRKKPYFCLQ